MIVACYTDSLAQIEPAKLTTELKKKKKQNQLTTTGQHDKYERHPWN